MKRIATLFMVLLPAAGACTTVFHMETAIPPEQVVKDDRLVGVWDFGDETGMELDSIRFEARFGATPGGDYSLTAYPDPEGGDPALSMHARLGGIGAHTVLEAWTDFDPGGRVDGWAAGRRLLFVVEIADDEIVFHALNQDALAEAVQGEGAGLDLEGKGSDRVFADLVIGDPTPRLHAFFSEFLERPDALQAEEGTYVLRRIR